MFEFMRTALINDPASGISTNDEAVLKLDETHDAHIARLNDIWTQQQAGDNALAQQRQQQAEDDQKLRDDEERKKHAEAEHEREKKRVPLPAFDATAIVEEVKTQFSPYVKKLASAREFIEMYHFIPEVVRAAAHQLRLTAPRKSYHVKSDENGEIEVESMSTIRAPPNVTPDIELTWAQFASAKHYFLESLLLGKWTADYVRMWAAFFVSMEAHPDIRMDNGEIVFVRYAAYLRRDFYDKLREGKAMNIGIVSAAILKRCWNEIHNEMITGAVKGQCSRS